MGLLICNLAPGIKFRQDTLNTLKWVALDLPLALPISYIYFLVSQFARRTWRIARSSMNAVHTFNLIPIFLELTHFICCYQTTVPLPNHTLQPCPFNQLRENSPLQLFNPFRPQGRGQDRAVSAGPPWFPCRGHVACHLLEVPEMDINLSPSLNSRVLL